MYWLSILMSVSAEGAWSHLEASIADYVHSTSPMLRSDTIRRIKWVGERIKEQRDWRKRNTWRHCSVSCAQRGVSTLHGIAALGACPKCWVLNNPEEQATCVSEYPGFDELFIG
jgi:hypothetical protein